MLGNIWKSLSCERYTELASKEMETNLTQLERIGYRLHHFLCTFCRRSKRQFHLIERALFENKLCCHDHNSRTSDDVSPNVNDAGLTLDAKERIKKAVLSKSQIDK